MAVDFDSSRAVRRPSERLALVEAVLKAHPSDEAEWLEWKTAIPLDQSAGRFNASRQVLGFANRSPSDAARFLGGQAFLVIGVEPGNLIGTPRRDPAELEDWLVPFLGRDGPVWDAHHVEIQGAEVLLLEIAPPREGDPIYTLRRQFERWHEGSVFVRHKGKTDPASSADMAMLAARASARVGGGRIAAEVDWTEADCAVRALDFAAPSVDALVDEERARLLRPLERPDSSAAETSTGKSLADLVQGIGLAGFRPEDRNEGGYRRDVDEYLDELRKAAPLVSLSRAIDRRDSILSLRLRNPTESNLPKVEVILHFPDEVFAFDPEDEAYSDQKLPEPPRPWGTSRPPTELLGLSAPSYAGLIPSPRVPRIPHMWIEQGGSVRISFEPIDLRPRAIETLAPFHLFVRADLVGTELRATWEATSTSADGVASGSLDVHVAEEPILIEDLLRAPNGEGAEDVGE